MTPTDPDTAYDHLTARRTPEFDPKAMTDAEANSSPVWFGAGLWGVVIVIAGAFSYALWVSARAAWRLM